ncbi:MAG: DUF927 domain-containing protein [Blautia sp.]|nr:DUF927 domain-containing protein [Blautia sp.]
MLRKGFEEFSMEEEGLYYGDTFLAPFEPVLEKIINTHDMDSGKETNNYLIKILLTDGKELEGHLFSSLSKIHFFEVWNECCDAGISKKQKELIYLYLQLQAQKAIKERQYLYGHLGLYKNAFVFNQNHLIWTSSEENVRYSLSKILPKLNCKGASKEKKIEYLCKLLSVKKGISAILFLCRLFSILKPLLQKEGYQTGVIVALYGKSGVGKTQLARTFFVQNPDQEKNFKTNSRSEIESALNSFAGHTVLIDDFHPESLDYGRKRQDSILDYIARKSDEERGALAVITAEFLSGCFSIQDRMLQLRIEGNDLDFGTIKFLQVNNGILVDILQDFAEVVYCNWQEALKIVKNTMSITSLNASDRRISYVIRLLKSTFEVFWTLCLDGGDKMEIKSKLENEEIKDTVLEWLSNVEKEQIKHMECLEKAEGEIDWLVILYKMLYKDNIFFICPDLDNLDSPNFNGLAVLEKKDNIYMRCQTLKKGLEKYFGCKKSPKPLINALLEEHILDEDRSSSHMKKKSDGNYYYTINESLLKLYYRNQTEQ